MKLAHYEPDVHVWHGDIRIPKARHGGQGKVGFGFDPQSVRFHD